MNLLALQAGLKAIETDLNNAEDAHSALEQVNWDHMHDEELDHERESVANQRLEHYFERLRVLLDLTLEAAELRESRVELARHWGSLKSSNGGLLATKWNGDFDFLECPTLEYVRAIVDGLRSLAGQGPDPIEAHEIKRLENLLRSTAKLLRDRGVTPKCEMDVQDVMHDYMAAMFTSFTPSPQISGTIKNFKPDGGVADLHAAIEFKIAKTSEDVKRALSGIFEDVSGYSGSQDWTRFYSVVYQTEAFETEHRLHSDFKRINAVHWTPILVTGGK